MQPYPEPLLFNSQKIKRMQISKNPFKTKTDTIQKITSKTTTTDRAKALFRHKCHAERHNKTNIAVNILSYLCNTLSGITTGIAITLITYKSLSVIGHYFALSLSVLIALAVIPIIEIIKRYSLKESIIDAIQYKVFNSFNWILVILFCSISVFASYYGAKQIPELTTHPPQLTNIDSIRLDFDNKISAATILYTYKPTNTITKKGSVIISDMQKEKRQLISDIQQQNKVATESHRAEIKTDARLFIAIALFVELLFILCFWASIRFYWNCFLESVETEPTSTNFEKITESKTGQRPPTQSNAIGFIYGQNSNTTKIVNNSNLRTCENCNKEYIYKHWKQKYCTTECRMLFWEKKRKDKTLNHY